MALAAPAIVIRGAREHNLRDVSVELPRNALICLTGVSGSGKSSLAFDTVYAEGQRRYVESLSSYARQFLARLPKPDVDRIDGLSPSIAIQQKTGGRNPRSTVGTITEIHDYLRVLYARVGRQHCPRCGRPVEAQTREQIVARLQEEPTGNYIIILAPVVRGQKGEHRDLFAELSRDGYLRARINGKIHSIAEPPSLDRKKKHNIEVVIDRIKLGPAQRGRLAEAVEAGLKRGGGTLVVSVEGEEDLVLSSNYACSHCGIGFDPPSPQLFSFNSPQGRCPSCDGLGIRQEFDPELLIPDPSLSVAAGAIAPIGPLKKVGKWRRHLYEGFAANLEADQDGPPKGTLLKKPWSELNQRWRDAWLFGTGERKIVYRWKTRHGSWSHSDVWGGIANELLEKLKGKESGPQRAKLGPYLKEVHCSDCEGARLNSRARAVRVAGQTLGHLEATDIGSLLHWFDLLAGADAPSQASRIPPPEPFDHLSKTIAEELLKEIRARLRFLVNVGLDYLTLNRPAPTLSGGEAQRIRLASQVGAGLVGVLYVLDEPSIGLHPRDNDRLISTLQQLRDAGNTVLVVEHDEDTMRASDHLIDFGPGPGVKGGEIVAQGSISQVIKSKKSLTGQYLAGKRTIPVPSERRKPDGRVLRIVNARENNLKGIDVEIPLGVFVGVTGVSGSGKSSLIGRILRESLARDLNNAKTEPGAHDRIEGLEHLDKMIDIDQSPIGRTPRSNPATYIKLFDQIRDLFAKLPESKTRGYQPGRFSFNVPGGRCEACEGNGSNKLEMDFLADVWVTCPICEGHRFGRETLECKFKGKSISDVLEMDVQEALELFENVPKIASMLKTLHDVGLDYLKLGQASPTLSGGEAQRIKLARELVKKGTGRTLYVLDEPTTGLHFEDVKRLLEVLHGFVALGNTVLVIEHNLDVIKTADWVIDLGPEGGAGGGEVVAEGTPEQIAEARSTSATGKALQKILNPNDTSAKSSSKQAQATSKTKRSTKRTNTEFKEITIEGAAQHNLKGIDVQLPRYKLSVCCGPSGSGKSSLAMDTLYAEGQRRYVESLSSYARQFLAPLQKPKVERITGLSPAISIEQKTTSKSPRSTVGTVTEIHDYLRILFARLGQPHCPNCGVPVNPQTIDQIVETLLDRFEGERLYLMAPINPIEWLEAESILDNDSSNDFDEVTEVWEQLNKSGFGRIRVNGHSHDLSKPPDPKLLPDGPILYQQVEVVVDRVIARRKSRSRLADSVESTLKLGHGVIRVARVVENAKEPTWPVHQFSLFRSCERCGRTFEEMTPHHFSFNSPIGWCDSCEGLGVQRGVNPAILIPDGRKSLSEGAVEGWPTIESGTPFGRMILTLCETLGVDPDLPFDDLESRLRRMILQGTGETWFEVPPLDGVPGFKYQYKGVLPSILEAARVSFVYRAKLRGMVDLVPCMSCLGGRLRDDAAAVRFQGYTLDQVNNWSLGRTWSFFRDLGLSETEQQIAGDLIREIRDRLRFLVDVGLDYLTLGRSTPTLSGGESQRIRLASQIGSGLTGVLYVLDEPTIGLHPRDNARLLGALRNLRDLGNTLVMVEHDWEVIEAADHLVDFGPGSGSLGGEITGSGTLSQLKKSPKSLTGRYLSGTEAIPVPTNRRPNPEYGLVVCNATHHNLKGIDVTFPIGLVTVVTGVSGSGKSSLVEDVLKNACAYRLSDAHLTPGRHDQILGFEFIDKVIAVDQNPIGSTPNSTPATYTGAFDQIRELFAKLPESKIRGYGPGRFSFNLNGGRCEACEGAGQKRIEMHFLPDVWVTCDSCQGRRYTEEVLAITYRGKSIAEVLELTIDEALELFAAVPKLRKMMQTLHDVGLGYVPLGQSATTLSGGEAQRVKLAAELARPQTGKTIYILDEPTTGLHADDVRKLLDVIHRLADLGNTVVVIELNLDVVKTADWVIDIGPEAGAQGGHLVVAGTPETVVDCPESRTGVVLRPVLEAGPFRERPVYDPKAAARREIEAIQSASKVIGDLKDVAAPWELDGRRWHTADRLTRTGATPKWDGQVLAHVVDRISELDPFDEPDWSKRTLVRIGAKEFPKDPPFFEANTGHEWVLTLKFRYKEGSFTPESIRDELGLVPFDQLETPVHSNAPRVESKPGKLSYRELLLRVVSVDEMSTATFDSFLKRISDSYLNKPIDDPWQSAKARTAKVTSRRRRKRS